MTGGQWGALDLVALADMVTERPELAGVGLTPILEGVASS